jgi:hypothetical protein
LIRERKASVIVTTSVNGHLAAVVVTTSVNGHFAAVDDAVF